MIKTHDDVRCYLMNKGFHVESEYFMAPISKWKYTLSKDGITRFYWLKRGLNPTELGVWVDLTITNFNDHAELAKIQASSTALRGDMIHGYSYSENDNETITNDVEVTTVTYFINYLNRKGFDACVNKVGFDYKISINRTGDRSNIVYKRAHYLSFEVADGMIAQFNREFYKQTLPEIDRVIFNDPATVVIWKDGTKTVVKASNEYFDPEKGLAMAIAKKAMGNTGRYFNEIKKWTEPYEAEQAWKGEFNDDVDVTEAFKTFVCSALGLDKDTKSEE